MAGADLRLHATCRPGGKCAGPPAELPHGVHESDTPLPLLEHELSRRAPHVPAGAVPQSAEASRTGESRHAHALQRSVDSMARSDSLRAAAGKRSDVPREA